MNANKSTYRARVGFNNIKTSEQFWKLSIGAFFIDGLGSLRFKVDDTHFWDYAKAQIFRQHDMEEHIKPCTCVVYSDATPVNITSPIYTSEECDESDIEWNPYS